MADMTEKEKAAKYDRMKEINRKSFLKRQAWIRLMLSKAEKAKIVVSDAEVEAEMRKAK